MAGDESRRAVGISRRGSHNTTVKIVGSTCLIMSNLFNLFAILTRVYQLGSSGT